MKRPCLTEIGYYAFCNCTELKSIVIPDSVQEIGESAFLQCKSLKSVIIPDNITKIRLSTFTGCEGLTKVNIPNRVTSIEKDAFKNCTELTSIVIPDSVTSIGENAFAWCKQLTSITIPDSVKSIEQYAFCGCTNAMFFVQSQAMAEELYQKQKLFQNHKIEKDRIFVNGNPLDPENAWKWSGNLRIEVPKNVVRIDDNTFLDRNIKYIDLANVKYIGEYAFSGCKGLTSITIPDSVQSIGRCAFSGCEGLTSITIPDSVKSIGIEAFLRCDNLKKIYVYSDRVKQLVINSTFFVDPNIIEVIEKPKGEQE